MAELTEGMFIAQGQETNILIRVMGKAPLLEIVGAIDLNQFYKTGKVESLAKDSKELLDIVSYPESYKFEPPSITSAIKLGMNTEEGRSISEIKDKEFEEYLEKYQNYIQIYGETEKAKNKLILWLKREKNIAISQGQFIITKINNMLNNRLV